MAWLEGFEHVDVGGEGEMAARELFEEVDNAAAFLEDFRHVGVVVCVDFELSLLFGVGRRCC